MLANGACDSTVNRHPLRGLVMAQGNADKLKRHGFSSFNKPKRTPGANKKFAVMAKEGDKTKLIRFGDPNMTIKKDQPKRRKSFRARHKCDTNPPSKLTARYWACKKW
jgi:hypothetical protein